MRKNPVSWLNEFNRIAIGTAFRQTESRFGYNPEKAGEMAEWLKAAVC